jgi:predicted pyridoxine 5'-phosphate oxidase superfamily flavin-nucleotide-binding protein
MPIIKQKSSITAQGGAVMISAEIKRFVESRGVATVASADAEGRPHLALGNSIKILDGEHLLFENWFCQTTLRNVERNRRVAIAVMAPESAAGYQFIGSVVHGSDIALLDGYTPGMIPASDLQALTCLVVRVEEVLAYCSGIHSDLPVGE